jgi:amidohydrolase
MSAPGVVPLDGVRPIDIWLAEHGEELVAIRRHLHAHPELSGEEHATTELIAERLELAGLSPRRLTSGTGLVCDLGHVNDGSTVALRADLDALGMDDEKDVPYRSQVPGVSHACGHDVHTAIVLGTALYLAHHRDEVSGRVRFLFQPAEERVPGGALDVLADGGLDGVGAVVGFHCDPKLPVGQVGMRVGSITSAADMARISLRGPGGHTARPEQTVDMVTLAAQLVAELPARVAEAVGGADQVKVVFGAIRAGDAANVIPAHAELRASVRTPSLDVWERLPGSVAEAVSELLGGTRAEFELDYTHGVPPVVNHAEVTDVVRRSLERELGDAAVTEAIQSWGGDDFAWYTREVPGTFVRLGVYDAASDVSPLDLHAGRFDADERSIAIGVRAAVCATRDLLAAGPFDDV